MDPAYAAARAGLALTYIAEVAQRPGGQAAAPELDLGLSEARQAVRLDPNLGFGYQVISFGLALQADYSGGLQAAQRAVELNPNDPDSMMALAKAQVRFGDYGKPSPMQNGRAVCIPWRLNIMRMCTARRFMLMAAGKRPQRSSANALSPRPAMPTAC